MAFLNLMRNKLKPLEVNNALTANAEGIADINALVGASPLPEGETITSAINNINSRVGKKHREVVEVNATLPAGEGGSITSTTISLIGDNKLPASAHNIHVVGASAGGYPLPYYVGGDVKTWIGTNSPSNGEVTLKNATSAWDNFTFFFDVVYDL